MEIKVFSSVKEMKETKELKEGDVCQTLGYYKMNDGGEAFYIITSDNEIMDDGGSVHNVLNGLKAKIIIKNDSVNVKQFGAKADGIYDDSEHIQNAINYMSSKSSFSDYSKSNMVLLNAGIYKITKTINLSLFTKLKTMGYVTIESYVNGIVFNLTPENYKYDNKPSYERYNYQFGELINGYAGFRVINKLHEKGNSIAFNLGIDSPHDINARYNISKTAFKYITINNFSVGIKINPYNFYLNTFEYIYMEQNKYCIVVGNANVNNYKDSGENICWKNCWFAGAEIVCLYNTKTQAIDFSFDECSFDFNNCLFYSPYNDNTGSTRRITIDKSHIEGTSNLIKENNKPHGILYEDFRGYIITIIGSRILQTNRYHLFYSSKPVSYTLNLISNIITTYGSTEEFTDPLYTFISNKEVENINIVNNSAPLHTGINMKLSNFNNTILRPDFRDIESGKSFNLNKSTINGVQIGDFKQGYFNKLNAKCVVVNESPLKDGKSIKFTIDTNNYWDRNGRDAGASIQLESKKIVGCAGDIIGVAAIVKNMNYNTMRITLKCYDSEENEISSAVENTPMPISKEWKVTPMPRFFKLVPGTYRFKVNFTFIQANNQNTVNKESFYIGALLLEKING